MLDMLLQSKLYPPPRRPDLVVRPQLLAHLDAGLARKLTIVSAPAGFGKTTLITTWMTQVARPFVWLSLDEDDNDLVTFFTYLAAAIAPLSDVGTTLSKRTQASQTLPPKSLATAFINDVTTADACGLVLDDYHVITNPAIHEVMAFMLEHLPPTVHLVITSRVDPLLPLPRLRVRDELTEVRTDELRFSVTEMAEFLHTRTNVALSPQMLAALENRTEGWIAGIHMAALSLRRMTDADEVAHFVQEFAGSHRYVFDYLMDEVLNQCSSDTRAFLLRTSILDRFCAPLCAAVIGDDATQARAILVELEQANLFIVPLDSERRWYRYHHLFQDLLRRRLAETDAAAGPHLYQQASRWYEEQGNRETAFHYAQRGGHVALAARLLDEIALPMVGNSEIAKLLNLLESLPKQDRLRHVRLCLAYAWTHIFTGQFEQAQIAVDHAEPHQEQPEALPPDLPAPLLAAMLATLRAYIATRTSQLGEALHQSTAALRALEDPTLVAAGIEPTHYPRGSILLNLGMTHHHLADDVHAAEEAYQAALPLNHAANRPFAIVATYSNFMRLRRAQGEFEAAIALGQQGLAWIRAQNGRHFPAEAEIRDTLSAIYYERNDLAAAEQAMMMFNGIHYLASTHTMARSYLSAFRLHLARNNVVEAAALLDQVAELLMHQGAHAQHLGKATLMQMKLLLWRCQPHETYFPAEAKQWMETSGLTSEDSFNNRTEAIYATLAQVLLVLDETAGVLTLSRRLCERAEKAERFGDLLHHQLVYALALDADGQRTEGEAILQNALVLAESMGAVRSIVDQGAPLYALLRALPSAPYRNRLLGEFGETIKTTLPAAEQNLIEPLSPRELEVLQLLAGGYANQEIANELIVALSTVKRHVSNIYGKLEVNNRTTAVARARELDLL